MFIIVQEMRWFVPTVLNLNEFPFLTYKHDYHTTNLSPIKVLSFSLKEKF